MFSSHKAAVLSVAEAERFELSCPIKDKTISSRSRYDHFDTPPRMRRLLRHAGYYIILSAK